MGNGTAGTWTSEVVANAICKVKGGRRSVATTDQRTLVRWPVTGVVGSYVLDNVYFLHIVVL